MPTQEHHRYTSSPSQTDPPRCFPCNSLNHTPRLCEPFHLEGRTAFLLLSSYKEADHDQLTTAWMKDLEDLTVAHRAHCDGLDLQHTAHTSTSLVARIEWCRRQEMQARTEAELEGWCAEEEGLRDALFKRDCTCQYRYSQPAVFERYAMGLEDGQALLRAAWVEYTIDLFNNADK